MALTLAIGFLVDDAIVFLENTVRLMEERPSVPSKPALQSARGNQLHDFSAHEPFSLAAVFLPLVFMSGLVGRIFSRVPPSPSSFSIFASGIVSLTLTPLMCSGLLQERGEAREEELDRARHRRHGKKRCYRSTGRFIVVFPSVIAGFSAGDLGGWPAGNRLSVLRCPEGLPAHRG